MQLDEIDARDFFGDRVLDLEARIGLDEREAALIARGHIGVDQKLEGAEIVVAHFLRHPHRGACQPIAHRGRESRTRRYLDDLLIAALDAAFALPQVADVARAVADDLHFDVTRARHQLLDIHVAVAERRARLGLAALVCFLDFVGARDGTHAAATAARHGLDHDRCAVAQRREEFSHLAERRRPRGAAQDWHAAFFCERARLHLVAEQIEHLGARSDKRDAGVGASAREAGVLAEKAVARMNRVAAGFFGDRNNLFAVEICGRARAAQTSRLVGLARMQRTRVVVRKDGHGADAHLGGGAHDANRDLAAVGDQKTVRGHISLVTSWAR